MYSNFNWKYEPKKFPNRIEVINNIIREFKNEIFFINSNNSTDLTLDKSNLWHQETTVIGIILISVVAKINFNPPPFSY